MPEESQNNGQDEHQVELIEDVEHAHPETKLIEDVEHAHPEVESLPEPEDENKGEVP